jgi:MFS family permease
MTNVSETLAISPISFWALGLSLGPMISASFSEFLGRQILFRLSLPLCLAFTIIGGSATTFRTIAVARFMAGVAGSPCVTVTAGLLNDVWNTEKERSGTLLVALFASGMVWATELGPPIGAIIVRDRDWRWTFWLITILLGVSILAIFPAPETFKPTILKRRAKKLGLPPASRRNIVSLVATACGRPWHMLLVEPIVWPTSLVLGILQAVVYVLYVAYFYIFQHIYSFINYQAGLTFLPLFIGSLIGFAIVGYFDKTKYQVKKVKPKWREDRLCLNSDYILH